jgi:hypothetical protein
MWRIITYAVVVIVSGTVSAILGTENPWFSVTSALALGFAVPLVDAVLTNTRLLRIAWYSCRTWRTHVRISASYLFRIHVDNTYLLVKGSRFPQYQPVGGVYKFHTSSSGFRSDINVLNDKLLVPDRVSEGDLRVRVPGKHLVAFVRWYESGRGRETDCWREFYEELIVPGILPAYAFRLVKYDFRGRRYNPMRYSSHANGQEMLIADVIDLIPTEEQLSELRKLKARTDSRLLWATEDQIRSRGAVAGASEQLTVISQTAEWTIDT